MNDASDDPTKSGAHDCGRLRQWVAALSISIDFLLLIRNDRFLYELVLSVRNTLQCCYVLFHWGFRGRDKKRKKAFQ